MSVQVDIDQRYWDSGYEGFQFHEAEDALTEWLYDGFLNDKASENKTVLEIGCFPGRYLVHFGKKGMELNGLDSTHHLDKLPGWLKAKGVKCGRFYQSDIAHFESEKKFDVVCSFGFIEHFNNYRDVIEKHTELNSENGTIIITTPNFTGLQYVLHLLFDKTNLKRHNVKAMVPERWAAVLQKAGYRIDRMGYFGAYDFWFDSELSGKRKFFRTMYMRYLHKWLARNVRFDSRMLSPYAGIIATKTRTG